MIWNIEVNSQYQRLPLQLRAVARAAFSAIPFPWNMGWDFARLHNRFWRSQYWSAEQLRHLQERELRRLVRHVAKSVPAYQQMFQTCGAHAEDIRTLDDLKKLPIISKDDVRANPSLFISQAIPSTDLISRTTGGTTGIPLKVFTVRATWAAERAMMYRGWRWAGFRPGDRLLACTVGFDTAADEIAPYNIYRHRMAISPFHISDASLKEYSSLIQKFDPHHFRTYPSIALAMGRYFFDRGIRFPNLKTLWTQSETLLTEQRKQLKKFWGIPVRDYYGLHEKVAAMSDCEFGRMHVHSEFGIIEFEPVPNSSFSRIIATGFWNPAMPLLRYDTHDLAIVETTPCPCGRKLPSIAGLQGRVEDALMSLDGRIVPFLHIPMCDVSNVQQYQFVQSSRDSILARLIPDPGFTSKDEDGLREILRTFLGQGVKITVEKVRRLEQTLSGKTPFVISHVVRQKLRGERTTRAGLTAH